MTAAQPLDPWLLEQVRARMTGATDASVTIVTAVATLLAQVAYADGEYSEPEQARVREELALVLGFGEADLDALCGALSDHIERLARQPLLPAANLLRLHLDPHMRADTVRVLIELAGSDREFSDAELERIRSVAHQLAVPADLIEALLARARELVQAG